MPAQADWWSATIQANRPERAWYLDSRTGLVTYREQTESLRVLAVRGGGELTDEPADSLAPATSQPQWFCQQKTEARTKKEQRKTASKFNRKALKSDQIEQKKGFQAGSFMVN
jgi:hypothetical protein